MARALQAAIEKETEAAVANTAKSTFLATISHEIRTPLNGVLGMAQAMSADHLSEAQRGRLGVIQRSGEALTEILNDVLDLSKIESGEITGSVLQDAKTQGQTIVKMAENLTSGKDAVDGIEGVETEEEAKAVRVPYQAITKDNLDLAKSTYE